MSALPATLLATAVFSAITTLALWLDKNPATAFTAALMIFAPLATIWATYAAGHFAGWWL